MSYNIYSSPVSINTTSNMTNITNLDEIEEHYSTIFYKVDMDPIVFVFNGEYLRKTDSCNLFLKFIINVIEYYCKPNEHMSEITVVLDLNKVDKKT